MTAKKTEILRLEKSSLVKRKFGNRSEDKVILSFAAAFALIAVFLIVMETRDNGNLNIEENELVLIEELEIAKDKSKDPKEMPSSKAETASQDNIVKLKEIPTTENELATALDNPATKEEIATALDDPADKEEIATALDGSTTKEEVAIVTDDPAAKEKESTDVSTEKKETTTVKDISTIKDKKSEDIAEIQVPEKNNVEENKPAFDLVRVDEDGSAIIAGSAKPNSKVRLLVDGEELETAETDSSGTFAILTTIPSGEKPLELQLEDVIDNDIKSDDTVLVIPNKETEGRSPKIIIAESDGNIVVQEENDLAPEIQPLSLDTINYAASGDVILAGRASSEQLVRVYVDNKPVVLGEVTDGRWNFEIPNIEEGIYTLRVDAINDEGQVVDRVESPFQRVIREMEDGQATIQPGFTLWKLAELKYGFGMRYVQIYEANLDSIKDPDLIYPGQVFQIPEK